MAFERLHYPALQKLNDKFEITALCDVDIKKANKWKETLNLKSEDIYSDYHQMIKRKDIDAFDLMVPIELNYKIAEDIAKAGKPFICEKPLAPTKKQALAARKLPKKYNVPILIAENYRYHDEINIIRDLIKNNEIGTVKYFIQNRVVNFPEDMLKNKFAAKEWRQHPEFPGGVILDTGVHDIGALHHIFGAVDKVHAFGINEKDDFSPYSVIQANLLFKSGVTGQFTFYTTGKEMQRPLIGLRIFGSKGMIYLEDKNCETINVAYDDGNSKQIPYVPEQGFYHELFNFYNAAVGKESISVPPEMEYGDTMTIFAILESIQKNSIINVDKNKKYRPISIH